MLKSFLQVKPVKLCLLFVSSFSLAFIILIVTITNSAKITYSFSGPVTPMPLQTSLPTVNYELASPGTILSDNILWPLKAIRDNVTALLTRDNMKKADLYVLLADKRLADAKLLFQKGKPDLGLSVATKGEKYLEKAKEEERLAKAKGIDTNSFLQNFALATQKHGEVIDQLMPFAPEDEKPLLIKVKDYSIKLQQTSKINLLEAGIPVSF